MFTAKHLGLPMKTLLLACGIVLTMWVLDDLIEQTWGPATVTEQAERSAL
jgi:hypothetical protein